MIAVEKKNDIKTLKDMLKSLKANKSIINEKLLFQARVYFREKDYFKAKNQLIKSLMNG